MAQNAAFGRAGSFADLSGWNGATLDLTDIHRPLPSVEGMGSAAVIRLCVCVYETLRAWEGASVLYFGALFGAFILSGVSPVLERHFALGPIISSCERVS